MASRRVALVTHATNGGVWSVVRFLSQQLRASRSYDADIVVVATAMRDADSVRLFGPCTWRAGPRITSETYEEYSCYRGGALLCEFEWQRYQPRTSLTRLLRNYDLIQVVGGSPAWAHVVADAGRPVCLFAATTAQKERMTLIQQSRGWRKHYWRVMTGIVSRIEVRALQSAACVFAESEYTRGLFAPHVPAGRLCLGLPGVDTATFRPAGVAEGAYILSVGRLADGRKNLPLLFDAYALLRQRKPDVPPLMLAGATPPRRSDWAHAVSLGIAGDIRVRTGLSSHELAGIYRDAALFVLSSNEEGLGLVIVEAMASGLPVVSTDCGGPATAIVSGQTGLLTPVGSAPALADAMEAVLSDPGLGRLMGRAGLERARAVFSYEAAARAYLAKYDELLGPGYVRH